MSTRTELWRAGCTEKTLARRDRNRRVKQRLGTYKNPLQRVNAERAYYKELEAESERATLSGNEYALEYLSKLPSLSDRIDTLYLLATIIDRLGIGGDLTWDRLASIGRNLEDWLLHGSGLLDGKDSHLDGKESYIVSVLGKADQEAEDAPF